MEMLLGLAPLTQYDAIANPIGNWDSRPTNNESFTAILPEQPVMCQQTPQASSLKSSDPMRKLILRSAKLNFDRPDSAPAAELNEILWKGIKGAHVPVPKAKRGLVVSNDD